jgi:hypothetical protein
MISEMTDRYECVTLDRAAELIGGDRPVSRATIQRMIRDHVLEARGAGRLRRVTLASIDAYRKGEITWRGDVREGRAASTRIATANGGRKSRSAAGEAGGRVRLVGKTPSKNGKRS